MVIEDINYWENEKDYKKNIISVFEIQNSLTKYLKSIKNKEKKEIIDFGCGIGNAIPHIKEFKKIYEVDFSNNMLEQAKKNSNKVKNIDFMQGDLKSTKIKKVDCILAVSSVMPKNHPDFDLIIENFLENLKKDGEMILVLPSLESASMLYHYKADYWFKNNVSPIEIQQRIQQQRIKSNYSPQGYLITDINLIQKHWLEDEIKFRLENYKFKSIEIEKLELDWEKQILGFKEFKNYPKLWFWLVKIKRV